MRGRFDFVGWLRLALARGGYWRLVQLLGGFSFRAQLAKSGVEVACMGFCSGRSFSYEEFEKLNHLI